MKNDEQELGLNIKDVKWFNRFLELSNHVSKWSRDPTTKVSAILVDNEYNVRALGYNGFPRGVIDSEERLNNRDLKYPITVHAEQNVIATCARLGIRTEGCTLVCTHFPCSTCSGSIIQAGIKRVVIYQPNEDFLSRWSESLALSRLLFEEAGVEVVEIDLTEPE